MLGGGSPSNNMTADERRVRALEAAEKRQVAQATRGNITEKKAKELDEAQVKHEYIGEFINSIRVHLHSTCSSYSKDLCMSSVYFLSYSKS